MRDSSDSLVAILFWRFGSYHVARVKAAAALVSIVGVELASTDSFYAWNRIETTDEFKCLSLFPDDSNGNPKSNEVQRAIDSCLDKLGPAVVVVPGYNDVFSLNTLTWCLRRRVPAVVMSESTEWDDSRAVWKEWIKQRIVGLASAALVGGTPHAAYIRQLGLPKELIFLGYDAVDNEYFAAEAEMWRCQRSEAGGQKYFLASSRFLEKKNLFRLLDAYAVYVKSCKLSVVSYFDEIATASSELLSADESAGRAPGHERLGCPFLPWNLVMLGDGKLKEQLLSHCANLGLHVIESAPWEAAGGMRNAESDERKSFLSPVPRPPSRVPCPPSPGTVFFPGFRQIDELPRFYAHAGAFVHASTTEQWGLVINEAMASGLPVIVSNRVGCAQDLVQVGVNGFTFDPYNVQQLAQLMREISAFGFPLSAFGAAGRAIVAAWGPERFAKGLTQAVECALKVGPKRASLLQRFILKALLWR